MTDLTVKLSPPWIRMDIYQTEDRVKLVKDYLHTYSVIPSFESDKSNPEEAFDLTNNPSRQEEREASYGLHRSVSVGDVVEVDGIDFLCDSVGWVQL